MTGRKDDAEKPRWDLLPFGPVREVVEVLTFGAKKYAPDNWQRVPEPRRRYFAAAIEAQRQSRPLAAAAVEDGKDAQRAVPAV